MYNKYRSLLEKIADITSAISVLSWDQEVNMPSKGSGFRAGQLATLSGVYHDMFTSDEMGELLDSLKSDSNLSEEQRKNVEDSYKSYVKEKKLSKGFVEKKSRAISSAYLAWIKSRRENDFNYFTGDLSSIVKISQEESELLGYEDHPYDPLLDKYEPEEKTSNLNVLFEDVRKKLPPLLNAIKEMPQVDNSFLFQPYDKKKQWDFGIFLLKQMGYDFEAGRQDISEHPFTTTFSPLDVRVTTRISDNDFNNMTFSCIHEGGHALYEQGLLADNYGLPAGESISLGIHESQSRLWENNVGRSLPYWKANFGRLQNIFPENLSNVSLQEFYKGINKVESSLIRTEADELTYHFHIMIRFELEKLLIEDQLEVKDTRDAWNEYYEKFLGIIPEDDNRGVLQDIHWSHGSFGYFPTYSLGSFYGAQFYKKAQKDMPDLELEITSGNLHPLLDWLRDNIHKHGKLFKAGELCEKVTGEKLNVSYFMDHAKSKFMKIYGFQDYEIYSHDKHIEQ